MRQRLAAVLFILITAIQFLQPSSCAAAKADTSDVPVIPRPAKAKLMTGAFAITSATKILTDKSTREIGKYISSLIAPATGMDLAVADIGKKKITGEVIILKTNPSLKTLGPEGYHLSVKGDRIVIEAFEPAGVFYGVQTLRQLLPVQLESREPVVGMYWAAPCVEITDMPRFKWRGLMLDPARHFLPKEFIIKYIDLMSMFKLNVLHLHLTDDQGWRLEIKKYPELTKIGAWRGKSGAEDMFWHPTGAPHGGFYTQNDMREIIAFAKTRFVTIVPEIEMPGHSQAALASIPGLGCVDQKLKVSTHWGVHTEIYCAGNEKTFQFLEDVLTEVIALFPGEYIHIGGDETPKFRWQKCPKCQARIKENKLKDAYGLQSYFIKRIETFLNKKGKKLVGWDEILQGGLPPRATVMSWQGMTGGITAAKQMHDVIMTPMNDLYFDYPQAATGEPEAFQGKPVPLCHVYGFEPVPGSLTPRQAAHVIGAQGSVWGEYISDGNYTEYMTYPRAAALSEIVWTPKALRNWTDFMSRLTEADARLDIIGVHYRKPGKDEAALCK